MLVRKCRPLPVECIVRGYLSGSGWAEYQKTGTIGGLPLPPGLVESQQLPEPLFTPSTKAELGTHDENISLEQMAGLPWAPSWRPRSRRSALTSTAGPWPGPSPGASSSPTPSSSSAWPSGELLLIDEVLTPDSSRFWPQEDYRPGGPQQSYDKQYLRDYLESLGWNKKPPPPPLPAEVINNTRGRYLQALQALTGEGLK